jgi:hypothetical protein
LKRGEVVEYGTFADLVPDDEKGEVKRLLAESSSGQQASRRKSKTSGNQSENGNGKKAAPKVADKKAKALTTKEEHMTGGVSLLDLQELSESRRRISQVRVCLLRVCFFLLEPGRDHILDFICDKRCQVRKAFTSFLPWPFLHARSYTRLGRLRSVIFACSVWY